MDDIYGGTISFFFISLENTGGFRNSFVFPFCRLPGTAVQHGCSARDGTAWDYGVGMNLRLWVF